MDSALPPGLRRLFGPVELGRIASDVLGDGSALLLPLRGLSGRVSSLVHAPLGFVDPVLDVAGRVMLGFRAARGVRSGAFGLAHRLGVPATRGDENRSASGR
jgi:hypothetical protein